MSVVVTPPRIKGCKVWCHLEAHEGYELERFSAIFGQPVRHDARGWFMDISGKQMVKAMQMGVPAGRINPATLHPVVFGSKQRQ